VQGAAPAPDADLVRQRAVVEAFFAAAREGDFAALLGVLDPEVVVRADAGAVPLGAPRVVRGAAAVAEQVLTARSGAAQLAWTGVSARCCAASARRQAHSAVRTVVAIGHGERETAPGGRVLQPRGSAGSCPRRR
jgi:ketosteroid isomerase-like protein